MYRVGSSLGAVDNSVASDIDPQVLEWLRHGAAVLTGKATLEKPELVVTTESATSVADWLKNPFIWFGVAAIVIALSKR